MFMQYFNIRSLTLLGIFMRWSVSLFPYSGAGKKPMHGDYEAQRHWQEITINLPTSEWYINSTDNDLMYWGLDYPPLTAYHSFLCGIVANLINNDYVKLHTSRGYESYDHKLFMRATVLFTDLLIYFSAAYVASKSVKGKNSVHLITFIALIFCPALILVDYGHFQYNNVSLGFLLFATGCILKNYNYLGAASFSLALNYKQMELYHALPFFFMLLGKSFKKRSLFMVYKLGVVVLGIFFICWLPFLKDVKHISAVVQRIFPIGRGLFEDKVASFWCSLSVFIKFKNIFDHATMALICLITTAMSVLPTCIHLFRKPTDMNFMYALINCSLIFFLFSFHVHEKSILLAIVPTYLLFSEHRLIVTWFSAVSLFSMTPLLVKDGLIIPTFSFLVLILLSTLIPLKVQFVKKLHEELYYWRMFKLSIGIMSAVTICGLLLNPPIQYPDLFPVLISMLSCGHFCLFLLYFHYHQFSESERVKNI